MKHGWTTRPTVPTPVSILVDHLPYAMVMKTASPDTWEVALALFRHEKSLLSHVKELGMMVPSHWLVSPLLPTVQIYKQGSLVYELCGIFHSKWEGYKSFDE